MTGGRLHFASNGDTQSRVFVILRGRTDENRAHCQTSRPRQPWRRACSLFWASAGRADTLTFDRTPASNVVAQMSHRYGVTIVFRGNVNANLPVTFSVDDAETPAGRLQAVSDLANALGLDFQKVYVVSKIDAGTTVPEVPIDSSGIVNFPATKVSAREAIETVAARRQRHHSNQRRSTGRYHTAPSPHERGRCSGADCQTDADRVESLLRPVSARAGTGAFGRRGRGPDQSRPAYHRIAAADLPQCRSGSGDSQYSSIVSSPACFQSCDWNGAKFCDGLRLQPLRLQPVCV